MVLSVQHVRVASCAANRAVGSSTAERHHVATHICIHPCTAAYAQLSIDPAKAISGKPDIIYRCWPQEMRHQCKAEMVAIDSLENSEKDLSVVC